MVGARSRELAFEEVGWGNRVEVMVARGECRYARLRGFRSEWVRLYIIMAQALYLADHYHEFCLHNLHVVVVDTVHQRVIPKQTCQNHRDVQEYAELEPAPPSTYTDTTLPRQP